MYHWYFTEIKLSLFAAVSPKSYVPCSQILTERSLFLAFLACVGVVFLVFLDLYSFLGFVTCMHPLKITSIYIFCSITRAFHRWHGVTVIYTTIAVISSAFGMVGNAVVICMAYRQRSQVITLHIFYFPPGSI